MRQFFRNRIVAILIAIGIILLAGVAIFTAVRLYRLRNTPVAPNAPESIPVAQQITLTPTPTPLPKPVITETSSPTPTTKILAQASLTPTQPPLPSTTNTPTPTPLFTTSPTPTQNLTPTPTLTISPTSTPTSTATLPGAGISYPTILLGASAFIFIVFSLLLIL